jgi:predicted aminopeptidase
LKWLIRIVASLSALAALGAAVVCLSGCANLGYYWQSVTGHLQMVNAAKPVDEWLADEQTPQALKDRLALSQRIRAFASSELKLPDNPSYRRYADLKRPAVVWNVVAAPVDSLTLKTWCFPVAGCVGYRGYFNETEARALADQLTQEGWETSVYGVPAYSTLGKTNWLGGDPLLSTFINYPEGELARMIFHELAHQVVYATDDTMFNESFATAVERLGSARWLNLQAAQGARQEYLDADERRTQFRTLTLTTRSRLEAVFKPKALSKQEKTAQAAMKKIVMDDFRAQYQTLRASWPGEPARWRGFDQWVARANNASFGAQAAYNELVPSFEALFARQQQDWLQFYDEVRKLAALPKDQRRQALSITP